MPPQNGRAPLQKELGGAPDSRPDVSLRRTMAGGTPLPAKNKTFGSTKSFPQGGRFHAEAEFSLAFQSGDGVRSNRFAAADGVHALVGFGLEIDLFGLDAQGVDVANRKAAVHKKFADTLEKMKAGNTLPFRVGVGEMRPDVAEASGAEERIANGVGEDVAVGMADGPLV